MKIKDYVLRVEAIVHNHLPELRRIMGFGFKVIGYLEQRPVKRSKEPRAIFYFIDTYRDWLFFKTPVNRIRIGLLFNISTPRLLTMEEFLSLQATSNNFFIRMNGIGNELVEKRFYELE